MPNDEKSKLCEPVLPIFVMIDASDTPNKEEKEKEIVDLLNYLFSELHARYEKCNPDIHLIAYSSDFFKETQKRDLKEIDKLNIPFSGENNFVESYYSLLHFYKTIKREKYICNGIDYLHIQFIFILNNEIKQQDAQLDKEFENLYHENLYKYCSTFLITKEGNDKEKVERIKNSISKYRNSMGGIYTLPIKKKEREYSTFLIEDFPSLPDGEEPTIDFFDFLNTDEL